MRWNPPLSLFAVKPARIWPAARALVRIETLESRCVPAILTVGPGEQFAVPSQAATVAQDGDDVQIDAGLYSGDVAIWRANNLTLEGVGGLAHLDAAGHNAEGKGIWVIKGDNTTVSSIEFSGATVPDRNGAGIRQEGAGLTVLYSYFHDNEDGILTGASPVSDIAIEYSEFAHNGAGDGQSHNMYIGHVRSFTLLGSYSHDAVVGHDVKTRADTNYILYNRIQDGDTGTASYNIDFSNGGACYVIGNVIRKGPRAQNPSAISMAAEGAINPVQELYVVNNTFVMDHANGLYVRVPAAEVVPVQIVNNVFAGQFALSAPILGPAGRDGDLSNNVQEVNPGFADPANFDYHLTAGSDAIDAGTAPGFSQDGVDLTPYYQYVDQANTEPRPADDVLDAGAYEYAGAAPGGSRQGPRHDLVVSAGVGGQVRTTPSANGVLGAAPDVRETQTAFDPAAGLGASFISLTSVSGFHVMAGRSEAAAIDGLMLALNGDFLSA